LAFSSKGSSTCLTCCDTAPPFLKTQDSHFWMPSSSEGAFTTYFSVLVQHCAAGTSWARTHDHETVLTATTKPPRCSIQ
jgi:hypothetical protein